VSGAVEGELPGAPPPEPPRSEPEELEEPEGTEDPQDPEEPDEPAPLPAISRARQFGALLRKEYAVASARGGFAIVQCIFLAYLAIVLVVWLLDGSGAPGMALEERGDELVLVLAGFAYIGALLLGPILGAGAFREERERGMIEVLSAVPVPRRDIFISIVGVRLLLIGQFFLAATPLIAVPIGAGAAPPFGIAVRALLVSTLGASATTLFATMLFARGHGAGYVTVRVLALLIATPLAIGVRWRWIILLGIGAGVFAAIVLAILDLGHWFPWILLPAISPFFFLGTAIPAEGSAAAIFILMSAAIVLLLTVRFAGEARREVDLWWQRERRGPLLEVRRRRRRGSAPPAGAADPAVARELLDAPLLATARLAAQTPVARWVYRASGGNAFVARWIAERTFPLFAPIAGAGLVAIFYVGELRDQPPRPTVAGWTALALLVMAVLIAIAAGRLLPERRRGRSADALLSSPLRAREVPLGLLAVAILETWPIFLALLFGQSWDLWASHRADRAGASVLLIGGFLLLVTGVAAWCGVLARRSGARVASALTVIALICLPVFLLGPDSLPAELSPLRIWVAGREDRGAAELLRGAVAHSGAGLLLLGLLAGLFDRITRRA